MSANWVEPDPTPEEIACRRRQLLYTFVIPFLIVVGYALTRILVGVLGVDG